MKNVPLLLIIKHVIRCFLVNILIYIINFYNINNLFSFFCKSTTFWYIIQNNLFICRTKNRYVRKMRGIEMRKDIIGSKLLDERNNQGKTLRDISRKLGWSLSTLSNIERGFISVSDDKFVEYAKELGIAEDLFGIEDEMSKREKDIMKELKHIEDILTGNTKVALERIKAYSDIHHFHDANTFAGFLKAKIYYEQRSYKKAKKQFELTLNKLDECPKLANSNLQCICYNELARIEYYDNQDFETCYELTNQAIDVFVPDGERTHFKGYLFLNQTIYLEGLNRIEEACQFAEKLLAEKENFKTNSFIIIQAYERYAVILTKLGLPLKALDYVKTGEQIAQDNKSYRRLVSIWITMGDVYLALGRLEEAKLSYQKSQDLSHHATDLPQLICELYYRFAQTLIKIGKIEDAEQKLLLAQHYSQDPKSFKFKMKVHFLLAKIQRAQNKTTEAKETYKKLEDMFIINDIPINICLDLCEFYKSTGNETKASYYQNLLYENIKGGELI